MPGTAFTYSFSLGPSHPGGKGAEGGGAILNGEVVLGAHDGALVGAAVGANVGSWPTGHGFSFVVGAEVGAWLCFGVVDGHGAHTTLRPAHGPANLQACKIQVSIARRGVWLYIFGESERALGANAGLAAVARELTAPVALFANITYFVDLPVGACARAAPAAHVGRILLNRILGGADTLRNGRCERWGGARGACRRHRRVGGGGCRRRRGGGCRGR